MDEGHRSNRGVLCSSMKQTNIQRTLKSVLRWLFCWIPLAFLTGVVSLFLFPVSGVPISDPGVSFVALYIVPLAVLVVNILFRLWEYAFDKTVRFSAILSCAIPLVLLTTLNLLFGW